MSDLSDGRKSAWNNSEDKLGLILLGAVLARPQLVDNMDLGDIRCPQTRESLLLIKRFREEKSEGTAASDAAGKVSAVVSRIVGLRLPSCASVLDSVIHTIKSRATLRKMDGWSFRLRMLAKRGVVPVDFLDKLNELFPKGSDDELLCDHKPAAGQIPSNDNQ